MNETPSWKIISAFLIDVLVLIVVAIVISFVSGGWGEEVGSNGQPVYTAHLGWFALIIWIVAIVAYYKLMKRYFGGTVGKKILKIAQ